MELYRHVISLESAKKLKELGVKQESLFYFVGTTEGIKLAIRDILIKLEA